MTILWQLLFLALFSSLHGFVLRPLSRLDASLGRPPVSRRGLKHFSLTKKLLRVSHLAGSEENIAPPAESNDNSTVSSPDTASPEAATQTETQTETEKVFREYPFYHLGLPVLDDAKNYYCGQYEDCFWHQNADQVLLYLPIPESVSKNDISAVFNVQSVQLMVNNEELLAFNCPERIIPDGSFWVIERDCNDQRYIQIDLEKRFRMINWNSLFGVSKAQNETSVEMSEKRSKMLEKLLAANKGMSKVTGLPPETINEMIKDETLLHALSDVQQPRAYTRDESGGEVSVDPAAVPVPEMFSRDQSIIDLLENRSLEDRIKSLSFNNNTLESRDPDLEKEIALITGHDVAHDSDAAQETSEATDTTASSENDGDEVNAGGNEADEVVNEAM